jgi:hypothetical protein
VKEFDVRVTVLGDKFLIIEPTRCTNYLKFYFGMKLYMFRTFLCPSSGVFPYTHNNGVGSEWNSMFHPDPVHKLSANLYDIYHCCVYSGKLLMMDRETVRNM